MLKPEQNQALMEVGPGTLMGELLRRYWTPFAAAGELDETPVKPVRLMGEDLVLYKDEGGRYGLVDRHCPHRRADLSYAWVEECGIRCNYHGWKFDETGACLDQPFEEIAHPDARFKDRITIKSYPVAERSRPALGVYGPTASARGAGVGALHLGQRLRPDRAERNPMQLVPVPGKLDRSGPLRVAARQLGSAPARANQRQKTADAPARRL